MDFGAYLRQARERRGISLSHIATATKIPVSALGALERNDISRLPGGIFTRAFVRAYAIQVGLDPEEAVRQFLAHFPLDSVTTGSPYIKDTGEHEAFESQRQLAATCVRLLLVSIPLAGIILYLTSPSSPSSDHAAQQDVVATGAIVAGEPPLEGRVHERASDPALAVGSALTTGPLARVSTEPSMPSASHAGLTIGLFPNGPCWVSLRVDGRISVARLMQAGEREIFTGREIVLNVGDAGAFAFAINGRRGRPLGSPGEAVRVRITPANYEEFVDKL